MHCSTLFALGACQVAAAMQMTSAYVAPYGPEPSAGPTEQVGDFKYHGCVTLEEDSDCFTKIASHDHMGLDLCAASCPSPVFGVYNRDCYCGKDHDSLKKVADSMCSTGCPGNGGQRCGGYSHSKVVVLSAYTRQPDSMGSTVTRTQVHVVTACPEHVKNCPVGSKTTAYNVETVFPEPNDWHKKKIICYGDSCAPERPCPDCDRFRVVCEADYSCRVEPTDVDYWHKLVVCKGGDCDYHQCQGDECHKKIVCYDGRCTQESCYGDECKKNFVCRGNECKHEQCQGEECYKKIVCENNECKPQPPCAGGKECPKPAPPKPEMPAPYKPQTPYKPEAPYKPQTPEAPCEGGKECPKPAPKKPEGHEAYCEGKECPSAAVKVPVVPTPAPNPAPAPAPYPAPGPDKHCQSKPYEKVVCKGEECYKVVCEGEQCHKIVCQGAECKHEAHEKCNGQGAECNEKYLCSGGECKPQPVEMCDREGGEECHEKAVCRGEECYKAICQGEKCFKVVCYGETCLLRSHDKCAGGNECTEKVICKGYGCGYGQGGNKNDNKKPGGNGEAPYPAKDKDQYATPVAPANSYATGSLPYNSGDGATVQVGGTDKMAVALNLLGAAAGLAFML
ncbi:hypothetical protein L249_2589 [Ophiocordyceps polyrhachis-furcata BCC 54312]|uniref:WSC domain-containing protein n=1 Tax=Ophiocordyceps polyrhachis-furcata BCC 54312 TaxID=1330021 RepID=A0A367LP82_9HYPO|nr:hypothetical protein L249_2589 [Ophiocordyceps polyrhachis-furcata BCC 54312]